MTETGKCILGIMFTTRTDEAALTRLTAKFGPTLLHADVATPSAETDKFYDCVHFKLVSGHDDPRDAKVFIAETGRWANLKLRFLPDEEEEFKIRNRNMQECAAERAAKVMEELRSEKEKAQEHIATQMEHRKVSMQKLEKQGQKLQEDPGVYRDQQACCNYVHIRAVLREAKLCEGNMSTQPTQDCLLFCSECSFSPSISPVKDNACFL